MKDQLILPLFRGNQPNDHLTTHFTLSECTRTSQPLDNSIPNSNYRYIVNLLCLCISVLEPLRSLLGRPISPCSVYRSSAVNKAVGGASNSYHLYGLAVDIPYFSDTEFNIIKDFCHENNIYFIPYPRNNFVHIDLRNQMSYKAYISWCP